MTPPAASPARETTSATTTIKGQAELLFAKNLPAFNMIAEAVSDSELYESPDEQKPSGKAMLLAASTLGALGQEEVRRVEIEPFYGELSLIWRSADRRKRVKVMFAEDRGFSVYHELLANKHVAEHHLEPVASPEYLKTRLIWLRS